MNQTMPKRRLLSRAADTLAMSLLLSAFYLVFGPLVTLLAKLAGRRVIDLADQVGGSTWRTRRQRLSTLRAMRSLT